MSRENTSGRGVFAHYGPRTTDEKGGGTLSAGGRKKQLVAEVSYDDLPTGGLDDALSQIPAGAIVTGGYISAKTAFAGGTSYNIGLVEPDGTAIDADGLWPAVTLAEINGDFALDGALLGNRLAASGVLTMAATGTFTAGVATITVDYLVDVPTAAEVAA